MMQLPSPPRIANAILGPAIATGNHHGRAHHGRAHAATADNSGSEQCASSVSQPVYPQPQAPPGAQPHPQRFISGETSSSTSGAPSTSNRIIVDIRGANADTDAWNVSIKRKAPADADRCACIRTIIAPCRWLMADEWSRQARMYRYTGVHA